MYIPCQIVDSNNASLESEESSMFYLRGLFCPCLSSQRRNETQNNLHSDDISEEDPDLLFARHRQKYKKGLWNVQNQSIALPPLPQTGPPPLPPRKLSSFFPPMEKLKSRRNSKENGLNTEQGTVQVQVTSSSVPTPFRKVRDKEKGMITSPPPFPRIPTINEVVVCQMPRGPSGSIACPYLNPVDVVETSWEWDFGKNETLRSHLTPGAPSPSEHESGATDKVNIWGDPPIVKKGLLMQQREKIWSRWRERYFILTRDYLHCFRRLRNVYRLHITLSAMGQFIYKLRLANVEDIRWDVRRSGSQICLMIRHEPTIHLRSTEHDNVDALYHWYSLLQECICMSKIRRQAIRVFNSSSEEDTNSSSTSNPSRFSGHLQSKNEDLDVQDNSSYTLGTSSGTSGGSSQADILDLYQRRLGGRSQSGLHFPKTSNSCEHVAKFPAVHNYSPSSTPSQKNTNQRKNSSSSCGFYLHDQRQSTVMGSRPSNQLLFKRFQLPALDSESEEGSEAGSSKGPEVICDRHPPHPPPPNARVRNNERIIIANDLQVTSPFYEVDINEADEEADYVGPTLTGLGGSRCESRLTLREFVQAPWRSNSCLPPAPSTPSQDSQANEFRDSSSRLSHFPVPARRPPVPQRPMSSFSRAAPPTAVFGGRKVLPTPWTRSNSTLQIGKGAAFSRSNIIVCPSKVSSDVTYLRRV